MAESNKPRAANKFKIFPMSGLQFQIHTFSILDPMTSSNHAITLSCMSAQVECVHVFYVFSDLFRNTPAHILLDGEDKLRVVYVSFPKIYPPHLPTTPRMGVFLIYNQKTRPTGPRYTSTHEIFTQKQRRYRSMGLFWETRYRRDSSAIFNYVQS